MWAQIGYLFFVALSVLLSLEPPAAQAPPAGQMAEGAAVFQKVCSSCHGNGGAGGRAVSLVDNRRLRALPRAELESIIRQGTSNGMPPFGSLPEGDIQAVTTFVRSFNASAFDLEPAGDLASGEAFFFGKGQCAACHIVSGQGAAGGPDLSNIGRQMTVPELTRALVEPDAAIAPGYATARVQMKDGRTLRGFVRNEGNHVLPLQTVDGRLVAVDKGTATITRETGSAMPPLKATADETRDLIAFLGRLGGQLGAGGLSRRPVRSSAGREGGSADLSAEARSANVEGAKAGAIGADFGEILKPRPGDWPTYHGRLDGNRHSALSQITTANVRNLSPRWIHSVRGFDNEMTPLVLDGIMYITATNQVSAIDAATGREIWRFARPRSTGLRGDAAIGFNRGAAVLGSRVFLVTDNAHLLAVSRVNGALLWEVVLPENTQLPYGGTMAPLVVGDLVIAGVSGGDEGIRGFLAAYRVNTGEQAWRFWTVPARGEPGSETWKGNLDLEKGGGSTWLTGTYDAETGTLFWPTGNPYPDTDGSERHGDNLYTNSILALEATTGKLRWHYQFTPHDLWDWDAEEPPVLIDAVFQGRPRKLLLQANRNGFFYVLDRTDGKVLLARPFVQKLTWASGIGPDGRPQLVPGNTPDENGVTTCPAIRGATNWMSTSFSPATRLFYVMAVENCGVYRSTMFGGGRGATPPARGAGAPTPAVPPARGAAPASPFGLPGGGFNRGGPGGGGTMALRALDLDTGHIAWEIPQVGNSNNYAGTLSTAGGVVFYGQASGEFAAVDAKSGAHLWHFETQETWKSSPMTYIAAGRQYVAITSGANVLAFALP
ncbi:MAG: PQQ-binding-like beta-propeller repeat protein [Vicinamibacterales bacterium]